MGVVGTSSVEFDADLRPLLAKIDQAKQAVDALAKQGVTVPVGGPAGSTGGASPAAQAGGIVQLQRAQASLEQQQARLARSQGDGARATELETSAYQRLTAQLVRTDLAETEAIAIQKQLTGLQQQTTRATQQGAGIAQQFGDSLKSSFLGVLGPAALVATAVKGIQTVVQGAGEALELRETKNSLRAVAGDTQTYTTIVKSARDQQLLFGGSLQENIEGLTGLAVTSRNTGANLGQLIDLQKRLTVLNPAQGATGGLIALNEALAGNVSSLSRRFNIPKAALAELSDASKPAAERLAVLSDFLDKVGISSEAVAGRVDQDAAAFRRLGAELGDTKLNAGNELATAFSGTATGLARVIGLINQNPQAIAELKALTGRVTGGSGVVDQSAIDDTARQIAEQQAKFSLAQNQNQGRTESAIGGSARYHEAIDLLTQLKLKGDDQADAATRQYQQNTLSSDQYLQKLRELLAADTALANGTDAASLAQDAARAVAVRVGGAFDDERRAAAQLQIQTGQAASDIQRSAEASTRDAAAKELQAAQTKLVGDQARVTTDAFLALNPNMDASGAIAAAAAQGYPPLIGQLAATQIQLNATRDAQINLNNAINAQGVAKTLNTQRFAGRSGGRGDSSDAAADAAASVAATKAQTAQTERQIDAQIALASAHGNTAKQIDLLRQKAKLYGKDEVDRQNIEAQIISLQKSAGKTRVDAAAATGLQLAQTEENSQAAILKAQREGQERLADQEQDYQLSRSRKTEDFERDYRKLLAQGQRARAKDLKDEFELSQRRAAEDFNIARQRTNRNNAESTGDINNRTDLRQSQINDRAALRGVRPAGGAGSSAGSAQPALSAPSGQAGDGKQMTLVVQVQQLPIQLDGKTIATASWAELREMFDIDLAETLAQLPPVGGGQSAVAGGRP